MSGHRARLRQLRRAERGEDAGDPSTGSGQAASDRGDLPFPEMGPLAARVTVPLSGPGWEVAYDTEEGDIVVCLDRRAEVPTRHFLPADQAAAVAGAIQAVIAEVTRPKR